MSDDIKPWDADDAVLIGPNGNPIVVREISSGFSTTTIYGLKIPFVRLDIHPPSCICEVCAWKAEHVQDEEMTKEQFDAIDRDLRRDG